MQHFGKEEFDSRSPAFNSAVAAFPGIDPFCTRTEWILPFHSAFTPENPVHIWQEEGSFLALSQGAGPEAQELYSSIDTMWGFASALVGPQSPELLGQACAGPLGHGHIILHGLPADRNFLQAVTHLTEATHRAFMLNPVGRCVASLQAGLDGFLSRRTSKFRVNARRAMKRAEHAGLQYRYIQSIPQDQIDAFYTSILAVEAASWKSLKGEGADQEPMRSFYREMFRRIIPGGMLRAIVAEFDGEDVGYIHGAFLDSRFRGLQLSFDDRCRELSIGNVLQLKMIEWLSRECAQQYDLGMCVAYKRKWAELEQATLTLYLRPRQEAG